MRILAWNIWGGSRAGISEVVIGSEADVAVLSDCRPSNQARLASELAAAGFKSVTGTNQADYTGLLIASKSPSRPGAINSRVLPGHLSHIWIPAFSMAVVGVYGPLRGAKATANLVPEFWEELIGSAKQLANIPTVLLGDLNTALSPADTTTGLPLPASKDLGRLISDGWRDAYREVHGAKSDYSYWESRGAYRIDFAMLSPTAPRAQHVAYLREMAGYTLGKWSTDAGALVASDHAALLVDI